MSEFADRPVTARLPAERHHAFSWGRVSALAGNTFLELVRMKVFYFLLIFAVLIIGSTLFLVQFTFQEQFQLLKDVSLGAMSIFTWLLAVLATAMLLPRDLEDRTLYTILAKPVSRFEYLLGKLLGVLSLLLVALAAMTAVFLLVLYSRQQIVLAETLRGTPADQVADSVALIRASTFNWNLVPGLISIYLKAALCASLTLLVSTFATSLIFTVIVSMMAGLIGHIQGVARDYWLQQHTPTVLTNLFLSFISLVFPDLQVFSLVDDIAVGTAVPLVLFWKMLGLGVSYTAIYLLVGYFLFAAREL